MSLLLNTIVRPSPLRSLPLLGHSHTLSFSAPTRVEPKGPASFASITAVLHDAANKAPAQKETPPRKSLGEALRSSKYAPAARPHRAGGSFKPLNGLHFVSPHSWTYENRTKPPKIVKRYAVGPSSKESRANDVFYQMDIDPLHESMNSTLMSSFVTELGKIKGRAETKLTWRSQRRLGKAIRRAKMMGIIPMYSRRKLIFPSTYPGVAYEK